MLYIKSINESLHNLLKKSKDNILIGEDLLDPYGGAFKASKGLSTIYPSQVISTPISEAGIVGSAVGMALRGLKPIVEIMFGDFITLAADQIVNHAAKYNWMYNHQVEVPMIIRTPVGARRGYGPTHSQSLENMFLSIPGLEIVSPSIFHNPGKMLERLSENISNPALFLEYKVDYSKELSTDVFKNFSVNREDSGKYNQNITLSLFPNEKPDIIIITYGGNVSLAIQAAEKYFIEEEILVDVVVPSSIKPIDKEFIINSVRECGKVIILEEGYTVGGWGAEIATIIYESLFTEIKCPIQRVGPNHIPIPSSGPMEKEMLPSIEKIYEAFHKLSL